MATPPASARTLVVWCPDWPVVASGLVAASGQGPGLAVAVVAANRVVACSASARADGVVVGLARREAQGRCPKLVVIDQDLGRDARAFEPVAAAAEVFTPHVEIGRPGQVAFGTRGPSRYFGGDGPLAAKVAAAVDAVATPLGAPRCQIGVADGPFAAEQAARVAALARPAGRAGSGPAGSGRPGPVVPALVVPARQSAKFLSPFPVTALDRPDLADLLARLGVRTLGDLAALPAETVLARFGREGELAHRLARGLDERPLAVRKPPPELTVAAELDPPAERVDMAMFAAKALADELHEQLAARGLACTRIAIEAETDHGEHLVRLWRHDGALTSRAVAERVRWQLEGWLSTGATTAGVTLIRLVPDEVKADHGRQLGFWGGSAAADDRAARALARVQGMLGPDGVVTAAVVGGRDPADQVRLVPWGDPRPEESRPVGTPPAPWPGRLPAPAPAAVSPERLPADLRDRAGEPVTVTARGLLSAAPAMLSIAAGPPLAVTAWAGPWPAEERWWDQGSARRRARFQVCLAGGAAYLAVLEAGRWWVGATYD